MIASTSGTNGATPSPNITEVSDTRPQGKDAISVNNIDITGRAIKSYLTELDSKLSSHETHDFYSEKWKQYSTYWAYGKTSMDTVTPRLSSKSDSGPMPSDLHGIRWISAQFNDATRMIVRGMFVSGKEGRDAHINTAFDKLKTGPWIGFMVYVKRTGDYSDDIVDSGDLVNWAATEGLEIAAVATHVVYLVALDSVREYQYSAEKLKTDEAELAFKAMPMQDDSSHSSLADPMFESICAAMEEAEKAWNSVAEFEDAVSNRFELIRQKGRSKVNPTTKKAKAESVAAYLLSAVDPEIVCDGVGVVNDVASSGFIAMMEELKEHRASAPPKETGRNIRHREKHLYGRGGHSFFVAKPVKRNEYSNNDNAMGAYWKEWKSLERRKVWQWETLREWSEVSAEARDRGEEVHLGFLFGLMVEKGSEFPEGDVRRYYKYRVVFRGNDVKHQNYDVAMFQEMATAPTTLEASRCSDLLASFLGNTMEGRDVEQA